MNTFFKTFFACMILTLGFLAYKFVGNDSYSSEIKLSNNNPIFGVHQDLPDAVEVENKSENKLETKTETKEVFEEKNENKSLKQKEETKPKAEIKNSKYIHRCYFYSQNGDLIKISRELSFKPSLDNALLVLFKGPTIAETKKGIYSEIPANVDLISTKRTNKGIIVDLSSNFGNGGGSNSIDNRIKQLSKTIKLYEPNANVYLYINGKEVEYLGGDGVYIKQPLD